jgi:serine phosphatase RsbU (regulator of sigma subunit)
VGKDGELTVVVGDATGHGMKAGTVVTITKSLFNNLAAHPDILNSFSQISGVIKSMKFRQLAMCLQMAKIKDGRMWVASAAMPPILIYRKKTKTVEEIFLEGMPLGTMKNFPYVVKEYALDKGDTILFLSDGLPELKNKKQDMFGYDRIISEFQSVGEKSPKGIIKRLKQIASDWSNGEAPDDDVTFVVIQRKAG